MNDIREYLYKAKRIDNGEWVEGLPSYDATGRVSEIEIYDKNDGAEFYAIDPSTTCEYTGLQDKNGKRIFEGDIYHLGDKNILYVVVWHDTSLIGKQVRTSSYAGLSCWQDRIEIIGNVFDNPELLEVERCND